MKVNIPWTNNKEIFMNNIFDGHWIITQDNDLVYLPQPGSRLEYDIKERFFFVGLVPNHTYDWLKSFCEEHHPEINFDDEFGNDKPGVFVKYQQKFGYDYLKVACEEKYNILKEELGKKGYELPWE
jgi:hypothetical protein